MSNEELEARIQWTLQSVAATVAAEPPTSWDTARQTRSRWQRATSKPRRRRLSLVGAVLAVCGLLAGAGTGIAAAAGAFSTSLSPALGPAVRILYPTATWNSPTELIRLTAPGPDGTRLLVGSSSSNSHSSCEAVAFTRSTQPKPSLIAAACSVTGTAGHPIATSTPSTSFGDSSHGWWAPTGTLFAVSFGEGPADAARVVYVTTSGTIEVTGMMRHGWYVIAVPVSDLSGRGRVEFYSATGGAVGEAPDTTAR
jgi:hypothetical protein